MPETSAKPSVVAVVALCLSITTAGFSVFQWFYGQREAKIAAAIDISRSYAREMDPISIVRLIEGAAGRQLNDADALKATKLGTFLDYVAFLANRNRLDISYLQDDLICLVAYAGQFAAQTQSNKNLLPSEAEKFAKANACVGNVQAEELLKRSDSPPPPAKKK